jgi:hypothetical protein
MKPAQARKLIGDLLGWSDAQATQEFHWLDLMARYKFDHYQGYGPGRRFYVSLLRWITQFPIADRATAYRLLREQLVFVGQPEMLHLVGLSGPAIGRAMRRHVADLLQIPAYRVDEEVVAQRRLKLLQARTLYVGVSDGARIDVFRRYNEGAISNEQVVPMAEISVAKWGSLHRKMEERLAAKGFSDETARFEWVCLIDDFTGSAYSSIRQEADGSWDGKVGKFVNDNEQRPEHKLADGACIQVHHYMATASARQAIEERCALISQSFGRLKFRGTFGYVFPASITVQASGDTDLVELLKRHYDPDIVTSHTNTGEAGIALGYRDGGLPLVLDHNTPNNSVAVLWARSKQPRDGVPEMHPLFPRRQRHMDLR